MNDLGETAPAPPGHPPETPSADSGIAFTGERSALLGLVLQNLFFTVVTLGVYRFWATTRVRRFYWGNVRLGGDAFEYLGTGKELLIGFLIALAVLVPAGLEFQLIAVFLAGLFVLAQYATYRARRYRLTRTSWRGVRFGLDGSAWAFTGRAIAWAAATVASLGLAFPWARVALARYWMGNARFGTGRFRFEGSGRNLIGPWLVFLGIGVVPIAAFVLLNSDRFLAGLGDIATEGQGKVSLRGSSYPFLLMSFLLMPFLYVSGTGCGSSATWPAAWSSAARASRAISGFHACCCCLPATPWRWCWRSPSRPFSQSRLSAWCPVSFPSAASSWRASSAPSPSWSFFRLLQEVILNFGLVRQVCRTLTVTELASFESVAQSSERGPGHGEGLADALDVDIGAF